MQWNEADREPFVPLRLHLASGQKGATIPPGEISLCTLVITWERASSYLHPRWQRASVVKGTTRRARRKKQRMSPMRSREPSKDKLVADSEVTNSKQTKADQHKARRLPQRKTT